MNYKFHALIGITSNLVEEVFVQNPIMVLLSKYSTLCPAIADHQDSTVKEFKTKDVD